MKIKVKYRNEWHEAKDISIDKNGELDFEYLHGLNGAVDNDHLQEYHIIVEERKWKK